MITIYNNGDLRQFYIYKLLDDKGIDVTYSNSDLNGVVILPITNYDISKLSLEKVDCFFVAKENDYVNNTNIKTIKYITDDFLIENAHLTSEGLLTTILEYSRKSFKDTSFTIIGYGRCGQACAHLYSKLGANIMVFTNNDLDKRAAKVSGYKIIDEIRDNDFIINTVPTMIINKSVLNNLTANTIILDIASSPGGTDFYYAKYKNIIAKNILGIPGNILPKSAAQVISKVILSKLEENNI